MEVLEKSQQGSLKKFWWEFLKESETLVVVNRMLLFHTIFISLCQCQNFSSIRSPEIEPHIVIYDHFVSKLTAGLIVLNDTEDLEHLEDTFFQLSYFKTFLNNFILDSFESSVMYVHMSLTILWIIPNIPADKKVSFRSDDCYCPTLKFI